jgi:hypothetical protein
MKNKLENLHCSYTHMILQNTTIHFIFLRILVPHTIVYYPYISAVIYVPRKIEK